jgi:hypothetical protein
MRMPFAAAVGALLLLLSGPAVAKTPEAEAAGVELARTIFRAISFEAIIANEIAADGNPFADIKSRPEWTGYLVEALKEEIQHDLPVFEIQFGRSLAKEMSLAELKAGVLILSDPVMQAMMRAGSEGDEDAKVEGEPSREVRRVLSSREGASFLDKLAKIDQHLEPLQDDFAADLLPGTLRRFADKIDAGEAERRSKAR